MEKGLMIAVSGFSGVGKGTIMRMLLEQCPEEYALSISATTRQPRDGEVEGVSYYFKTNEEFEAMIAEDQLIEYAGYVDHYYGTPKKFVFENREAGRDVLLEIEVQGALQVREKYPETILVFIVPPSIAELERRLRERGTETEESILKRLRRAAEEMEFVPQYDYILVNDDLETAVENLKKIIAAGHCRAASKRELLAELQTGLKEYKEGAVQ